jgi:SAM-dependent methyltransferase
MNFDRLYEYRLSGTDQRARDAVWSVIAADLSRRMGNPDVVLDPACGRGEFIRHVPARTRWAMDQVAPTVDLEQEGVHVVVANLLDAPLPEGLFDGILLSNVLEHLGSYEDVQRCLSKMRGALRPTGVLAVLGPNFKYCPGEYFDCADHVLPLTHVSVEEHLYAAEFTIRGSIPRYLPYSFRGILPPSAALTRVYLHMPWAWRFLGKQFLVLAGP